MGGARDKLYALPLLLLSHTSRARTDPSESPSSTSSQTVSINIDVRYQPCESLFISDHSRSSHSTSDYIEDG